MPRGSLGSSVITNPSNCDFLCQVNQIQIYNILVLPNTFFTVQAEIRFLTFSGAFEGAPKDSKRFSTTAPPKEELCKKRQTILAKGSGSGQNKKGPIGTALPPFSVKVSDGEAKGLGGVAVTFKLVLIPRLS